MPFLLPVFAAIGPFLAANAPAIAAAASLAGAGATIGTDIYQARASSDAQQAQMDALAKAGAPTAQSAATATAQKASVSSAAPNIQSASGGSLSPEYWAGMLGTQTGVGADPQGQGNIQAIINQAFGLGAPGNSGFASGGTAPGGNSITDLLNKANIPGITSGGVPGDGGTVDSTLHGFS